jgi:DNA-binding NarL/FixJ family response regulator
MIRILIVEDQTLLRDALAKIISGQEDMRVAGVAENADNALDLCRELAPDLALIDVVTDNKANGLAAAAQIRRELPDVKIVVMTALPEITFMDSARKAGAHSFIYKDSDSEHLLYVIRGTMKGKGTYPGPVSETLVKDRFSEAEIKVIRLVCQGKKRNEIVQALAMSESSVKALISSILDKTGFESVTKFSMYAVAHEFIVADHDH